MGVLVGHALAADKGLATLPLAFQFGAMMAVTIPASIYMKRFGRRIGFITGALIGATGAVIATIADMIARAVDAFGRLDILVNNVSRRIAKPVAEIALDEWRGVIASTLDGAFLCTRAALPHLEASDRAAIVNIGGVSGHAGVANRTAVAAAKAGLVGLTGSLAAEFASCEITVNCIAPGHFEHAGEPGRMSAHFRERPIPLGRAGQPEDIAAMVRMLSGPHGRYITGQTIHVNGGWHIATWWFEPDGWSPVGMSSTTTRENSAMELLEIEIDARADVHSETTPTSVRAGPTAEVRNAQEAFSASILTADLEAVARCHRAKAFSRFAQDLFRQLRDAIRGKINSAGRCDVAE